MLFNLRKCESQYFCNEIYIFFCKLISVPPLAGYTKEEGGAYLQ